MKLGIQAEKRFNRYELMIWINPLFVMILYFYPINHEWAKRFGMVHIRVYKWEYCEELEDN